MKTESELISKAAYDKFEEYWNKADIPQKFKSVDAKIAVGMLWLSAFYEGYDFRKTNSILNTLSDN